VELKGVEWGICGGGVCVWGGGLSGWGAKGGGGGATVLHTNISLLVAEKGNASY